MSRPRRRNSGGSRRSEQCSRRPTDRKAGTTIYKFETGKDRRKLRRSLVELAVVVAAAVCIVRALVTTAEYHPYDEADPQVVTGEDRGFLALSYFGVDRTGTETLISTERLGEHLKALRELGYVTVTQQDILAYYREGKPLPEKALFLMFEDGRRDTAIFSQPILEENNDIATILSYAEKFEVQDSKFLSAKDMKQLEKSTFWEMGTNGYRLSYINVFDRYRRYLGELNSWEYVSLLDYLGRDYNHYLMDYIRDADGIPLESYAQMEQRISGDYDKMEALYTEKLGYLPGAYVLMHANTGMFGNVKSVSQVNEQRMTELFQMNFNREGYSLNDRGSSIFDLTRMQPQAYWYTNHLLMRIWDDLDDSRKGEIVFVDGDPDRKAGWETEKGASEFQQDKIVLTSLPRENGWMRLTGSGGFRDVAVSVVLTGNKLGVQTVYLRCSEDGSSNLAVRVQDNWLYVEETVGGAARTLFQLDLYTLDEPNPISVEEDSRDALAAEYDARASYAGSVSQTRLYRQAQHEAENREAKSVEEGAEIYVPELQLKDAGRRALEIQAVGNKVRVTVDGTPVAVGLETEVLEAGAVCLESAWSGYGYSQRNLADEVYDGVFEKLLITQASEDGQEAAVLYDNRLHGLELAKAKVKIVWNRVVDWFVETF